MAAELWVQTYNWSSSRPRVTWPAAGSGTVALPRRVSRGAPARAAANLGSGLLAPKPQLKARADGASAESKTRRPMTPHDRSIRMCRAVARLSRAGPRGRAPAAPGPHRVGVLPVPRRGGRAVGSCGAFGSPPPFWFIVPRGHGTRRAVHADFILFSMRWTGPEFIYRVKDVGRVTLSHRGPARARLFTRSVCLVRLLMCSRLFPRSPLLALAACCSPWPCCSVACALPACAVPPATADAHVHFHLRHEASRPRRPAGAARRRPAAAARRARETREHAGHAGHAGQAWGWQAWGQRGGPSQGAGQGAHRRPRATQIR